MVIVVEAEYGEIVESPGDSGDGVREDALATLSEKERAMVRSLKIFERVTTRFFREEEALIGKYPNKWVLMGEAGLLVLGDTADELWEYVESEGLNRRHVTVAYLDPDPPVIL